MLPQAHGVLSQKAIAWRELVQQVETRWVLIQTQVEQYIRKSRWTSLVYDIGVEHALLLQIVRDGVLGQERGQEADFGADPFAFGVGRVGGVVAAATAAKLRTEVGALDLIELLDLSPGFVGYRPGDV